MKRVVITGMGVVSPLANGVDATWKRLLAGESGINAISDFDVSDIAAKIGGQVPTAARNPDHPDAFDPDAIMDKKEQRKNDQFIIYGVAAACEAIVDSGWVPETEDQRYRTGVMIGSGIGGLPEIYETTQVMMEKGPRRVSPFFIPASLINLVSGQVSIKYGFKGPNHAVVTACATGTHAIGDAARMIMLGDADVMVAGGAEAAMNRIGMAGFAAARALSTGYNDTPEKASRPFDQDRDGFVMGEGAGVVVLEEYEHAKARGAKIYAEVIGYGMSGDAHHVTSPAPDGNGGFRAMKAALDWANITPDQIDYVNAHGTSTPAGDEIEVGAVRRLLGDAASTVSMSSTKSSIGHLLGAAGAVEAIFGALAIRDQVAPPTLNLDNPAESCADMDLVAHKPKERKIDVVVSNSFGFGGTNATLVFRKLS